LQWLVMNLCASGGSFWRLIAVVGNEFVCISGRFLMILQTEKQCSWSFIYSQWWLIWYSSYAGRLVPHKDTCHTSEVVSSWVTLQSCQVSKWVLNQEHLQKLADCHWKMASLWTINDELTILLVGPVPLYQARV
jgi:hypothetical protein